MTWNPEALDALGDAAVGDVLRCWSSFCERAAALLLADGRRELACIDDPLFSSSVATLCEHGLGELAQEHFLRSLQESFKTNAVLKVSKHINAYFEVSTLAEDKIPLQENWVEEVLSKSLEEICMEKHYQENCLAVLLQALETSRKGITTNGRECKYPLEFNLTLKYQLMVSSVLLTTLPRQFSDTLHLYFKQKLEELSNMMDAELEDASEFEADESSFKQQLRRSSEIGEMDIDGCNRESSISVNDTFVNSIGKVVQDLRNLGLASMTEDAYASAIFLLLKAKVHELAGDDYRNLVLGSIKEWIKAVPLKFLSALLTYLGDSSSKGAGVSMLKSPLAPSTSYSADEMPSEGLVRWQLRLEYLAYETLQDLRIGKLFEIIVDYPDSSPAIEDLTQCLEYTGQHSKLVDSFISSLRHRLLTAGASTNDILHQYVSTIKALRTIDPTGVFLEAVGEPIRDYLRGRKDTIKCIVTMLTDGTGGNSGGTGNAGDSLLEELNRDAENQESVDYDDDIISDDKQAWVNSERWEPDPVEADPSKGSRNRRKIDILGMIVSLIGSKDQLVNEYRVMLAEKLLSKSDYDIDSEIRTLELLKIHFGESSMQKCEIMLNDLIDSKRTNTNIKASASAPSVAGLEEVNTSAALDIVDSTIISSNFWPTIQAESLNIPASVDQLLSDYAKRYHQIKAPRKLLWKKSLGTVKLELQFEDKNVQFTVSPLHAVIIMQFQDQASWTSKDLAAAVGVPVDALNRRINYWISKGILLESVGPDSDDHVFTLVSDMTDANRTGVTSGNSEGLLAMDEEGERTVASVEEQLKKEMIVYEKFIVGMLTNFGSMTLDRIHNTLKMFCIAEPSYDKSLQQLQSFLSGLVTEEKLEMRDGQYYLKK